MKAYRALDENEKIDTYLNSLTQTSQALIR
jgi:hypothetical protein